MTVLPFDPNSPGGRRLARDWAPELERWEMRVPHGHLFRDGDRRVVNAGHIMEVGAPSGRALLECGYELVRVSRLRRDQH